MAKFVNLTYIRAAIEQATGIHLTLRQVATYLVEEGLVNPNKANLALHFSYDGVYPVGIVKNPDLIQPIDKMLDIWEPIEDELDKDDT